MLLVRNCWGNSWDPGTAIITGNQFIAGKWYLADLYTCQSCPDPLMSMSVVGGAYTCACPAAYSLVGVSGIGAQSCVLTSLTNARKDVVNAASQVRYYDSSAEGKGVSERVWWRD